MHKRKRLDAVLERTGLSIEQLCVVLQPPTPLLIIPPPPPPPPPTPIIHEALLPLFLPPPSMPLLQIPPLPPPPPSHYIPTHAVVKRFFPKLLLLAKAQEKQERPDVYSVLIKHPKKFYRASNTTPAEFEDCYQDLKECVKQARNSEIIDLQHRGRKTMLSTHNRVLLVFIWFRLYWCYSEVMLVFGVDESYISREIHHIVPIIYWVYRFEIRWPSEKTRDLLEGTLADVDEGVIGSMDFTITTRSHSTTFDDNYYRGDKGAAFLNNFAAVDFRGLWFDFEAGYGGRANDQRAFVLTDVGKGEKPLAKKQKMLADGGFSAVDQRVCTPYQQDSQASRIHKANRCGVEMSFRDFKILGVASEESRHSAAFQAVIVTAAARLCNHLWRKRLARGVLAYDLLNSEINNNKKT